MHKFYVYINVRRVTRNWYTRDIQHRNNTSTRSCRQKCKNERARTQPSPEHTKENKKNSILPMICVLSRIQSAHLNIRPVSLQRVHYSYQKCVFAVMTPQFVIVHEKLHMGALDAWFTFLIAQACLWSTCASWLHVPLRNKPNRHFSSDTHSMLPCL